MTEVLLILLPLAFYSGWQAARKRYRQKKTPKRHSLPDEYIRGINYLLNEQPDKALHEFLHSRDRNEITGETHLFLGNLFRGRGEIEQALQVHQNLLARPGLGRQQKSQAMVALAEDYCAAGLLDRAERVLHELLTFDEKSEKAHIILQRIYARLHEWEQAIAEATILQKLTGEKQNRVVAHYFCEMADDVLQAGASQQAWGYSQMALKKQAHFPRAIWLQGQVLQQQTRYHEALNKYQEVAKISPTLLLSFFDTLIECAQQIDQLETVHAWLWKLYEKRQHASILECLCLFALRVDQQEDDLKKLLNALREYPSKPFHLSLLLRAIQLFLRQTHNVCTTEASNVQEFEAILQHYLNTRMVLSCEYCGYEMRVFSWQCPSCHHWETLRSR